MFIVPTYSMALAIEYARQQRLRNARVMPRIVKVFNVTSQAYEYRCSDKSSCMSTGWGPTPEAAYEQWLSRFARCRRERAT